MDRSRTSAADHSTAMSTAGSAALDLLLPATTGDGGEPAPATTVGRTVLGVSVLRQPAHGGHAGSESQTHPTADAAFGNRSSLSETSSSAAMKRFWSIDFNQVNRSSGAD